MAHVGGLSIVVRCLAARRTIILGRAHPEATLASVVPAQLEALEPGRLRAVLLGGAAAPRAVREAAIARGLPILTTYGMTETWGQVATQPLARAGCLDDGVGVPLPGIAIAAGTPEAPAPIRITGPTCPPTTTADLGFLDARGWLHVVGRADDMIITGGENVHPQTVEDELAAAPGVVESCVFGVPDPRWGQRIVAALVLAPDATLDPIRAHAAAHLASHQRPREYRVVPALPRTASGKVDRRALSWT
jgi:O-succinylbenzoic acid--CoA ligase